MPDENDDNEPKKKPPPRQGGEGVRIIGAEEAAVLDARQAGRLPDDAPRFGDRPPAPEGPRPSHRFPLPESESPQPAVSRPATPNLPHWTEPPTGEVPRVVAGDEGDEDELKAWSSFSRGARWRDQSSDWDEPDFEDPSEL